MQQTDNGTAALVRTNAFGGVEAHSNNELARTREEAQAIEAIRARYVMAHHRPRNILEVRRRLLEECKRPGFAQVAWYSVTNKGEGFSARFADAAFRAMGNLSREVFALSESEDKRTLRIQVTDLETNSSETRDIIVPKTVERRQSAGREVLSERVKKDGKKVYNVRSTEDELFSKESNLASKVRRQCTLSMIPGDILDECKTAIFATRGAQAATDPKAELKKIADAFAEQGVMPSELEEYLGHSLAQVPPAQIQTLRDLYQAVRDGEFVWAELLQEKRQQRAEAKKKRAESQAAADDIKSRTKSAKEKEKAEGAEPARPSLPPNKAETDGGQVIDIEPTGQMNASELLKAAKEAGLNAAERKQQLAKLFDGREDAKDLTGHERWMFVKGWLEQDPDVLQDLKDYAEAGGRGGTS